MKKAAFHLTVMMFLLPPLIAGAATPPELAELRQQFTAKWQAAPDEAAKMDAIDDYIRELTSLVYYMRGNSRSREEINAVRRELRRADEARLGEMDLLLDVEEEAAPEKAAVRTEEAPAAEEPETPARKQAETETAPPPREPETVVMTTRGLAGAPDFSRNNVYAFTLKNPGSRTTLTYRASGRRSTDTYGDIFMTTPDGKRHRAGKWQPDDFSESAEEAGCKGLVPITLDISDYVSAPGPYAIEFRWNDGIDPLVICRVKIKSLP